MPLFRKTSTVEAVQWKRHGDHPAVKPEIPSNFVGEKIKPETHGLIETVMGPMLVSPGDWIVGSAAGEQYAVPGEIFAATYIPASGSEEARAKGYRQTYGEYLMGLAYGPQPDGKAARIRRLAAELIDEIAEITQAAEDARVGPAVVALEHAGAIRRARATAITNVEQGAEWAVKALQALRRY